MKKCVGHNRQDFIAHFAPNILFAREKVHYKVFTTSYFAAFCEVELGMNSEDAMKISALTITLADFNEMLSKNESFEDKENEEELHLLKKYFLRYLEIHETQQYRALSLPGNGTLPPPDATNAVVSNESVPRRSKESDATAMPKRRSGNKRSRKPIEAEEDDGYQTSTESRRERSKQGLEWLTSIIPSCKQEDIPMPKNGSNLNERILDWSPQIPANHSHADSAPRTFKGRRLPACRHYDSEIYKDGNSLVKKYYQNCPNVDKDGMRLNNEALRQRGIVAFFCKHHHNIAGREFDRDFKQDWKNGCCFCFRTLDHKQQRNIHLNYFEQDAELLRCHSSPFLPMVGVCDNCILDPTVTQQLLDQRRRYNQGLTVRTNQDRDASLNPSKEAKEMLDDMEKEIEDIARDLEKSKEDDENGDVSMLTKSSSGKKRKTYSDDKVSAPKKQPVASKPKRPASSSSDEDSEQSEQIVKKPPVVTSLPAKKSNPPGTQKKSSSVLDMFGVTDDSQSEDNSNTPSAKIAPLPRLKKKNKKDSSRKPNGHVQSTNNDLATSDSEGDFNPAASEKYLRASKQLTKKQQHQKKKRRVEKSDEVETTMNNSENEQSESNSDSKDKEPEKQTTTTTVHHTHPELKSKVVKTSPATEPKSTNKSSQNNSEKDDQDKVELDVADIDALLEADSQMNSIGPNVSGLTSSSTAAAVDTNGNAGRITTEDSVEEPQVAPISAYKRYVVNSLEINKDNHITAVIYDPENPKNATEIDGKQIDYSEFLNAFEAQLNNESTRPNGASWQGGETTITIKAVVKAESKTQSGLNHVFHVAMELNSPNKNRKITQTYNLHKAPKNSMAQLRRFVQLCRK